MILLIALFQQEYVHLLGVKCNCVYIPFPFYIYKRDIRKFKFPILIKGLLGKGEDQGGQKRRPRRQMKMLRKSEMTNEEIQCAL